MNRRKLLASAAALPFAARTLAFDAPHQQQPAGSPGRPQFERYQLTLNRVLRGEQPAYTPEFLLDDLRGTPSRRFTNFSGDTSGRWIGALASCSAAFGDSFPILDQFVADTLKLQHPEGYFGRSFNPANPADDDMALLWGNGRLLVGLLEYHALKPNPRVLAAARGIGDFLLRIAPQFNSQQMADAFGAAHFASSYICWTQQTEGLAALYAATHDTRYRELCAAISTRIERRPGDHVHGYLCSVRGMLDLYSATNDTAWLQRTVAAWNDVAHSGDLLITGGVPEAWSPIKKRTEGCAEGDWLRLNLALHRATGEDRYLDAAEDVLLNDFAMNQFSTGDFGHGVLDEFGAPQTAMVRAWWCCTLHGLRTFADIQRSAFRTTNSGFSYDLPVDADINTNSASLQSRSLLETERRVRIQVQRATAGQTLDIRKARWADSVTISRNGRSHPGLRVSDLHAGDQIDVSYAMSLRVSNADAVLTTRGRSDYHYGPWLLGATSVHQPEYFNELYPENILISGSERPAKSMTFGPFSVPVAATTVSVIPAEFPNQRIQAQLRAVAEQTAWPPARWAISFQAGSSEPGSS